MPGYDITFKENYIYREKSGDCLGIQRNAYSGQARRRRTGGQS
jgi:hypothetical protein